MKILWITMNLLGLSIIVGGCLYGINHKGSGPIVMAGMVCMGLSNIARLRFYRNKFK